MDKDELLTARRLEARNDSDAWREWYLMDPLERWEESKKLWQFFLQVGGSLDPEPDPDSPFDAFLPRGQTPVDGGTGMRVLRRGRV